MDIPFAKIFFLTKINNHYIIFQIIRPQVINEFTTPVNKVLDFSFLKPFLIMFIDKAVIIVDINRKINHTD